MGPTPISMRSAALVVALGSLLGACPGFAQAPQFDPWGWRTDFGVHSVPLRQIRSGGPGKDGIPPVDHPRFVSTQEARTWLRDREPVVSVTIDGETRAYPLQILIWHEIVNDELASVPITVTFCPLCYAAVVWERPQVGARTLSFGTTGNLRMSDMVMWDRQTESWWQQMSGEAIVGSLTGQRLVERPAAIIGFGDFRRAHPDAEVLSRRTGHRRAYGRNPYVGYDDVDRRPFMYRGSVREGMAPMARVVAVRDGGRSRAFPLSTLRERRVVNDRLGRAPLVVLWSEGTASAVSTESIAAGVDIGASGVFSRRLGGRTLSFEATEGNRYRDRQTQSTWDITGMAVAGPLRGQRLTAIAHHDVFWFVWSAFMPNGTVYGRD